MKATTTRIRTKAAKRPVRGRGVPFEEMLRLMHIYGSIKCLRNRTGGGGGGKDENTTKINSIKRKFHRWFPDLDERFEKDELSGLYQPKFGHEFEIRYREKMRRMDGEILVKKRAARLRVSTKKRRTVNKPNKANTSSNTPLLTAPVTRVAISVSPEGTLSSAPLFPDQKADGVVDTALSIITANITTEEPIVVDCSFIAEQGIFDDVEKSFYGLPSDDDEQDCPSSTTLWSSSCSSSSSEDEPAAPLPLEGMLDNKLIEDSFEEIILGSDDLDFYNIPSNTTTSSKTSS